MQTNNELILDIKRMGINGEGIAFYKRKAIFIDNAIVGEVVKAEIVSESDKMAKAKIVEVIKKSPYRVDVKCEFYDKCGGCQTMHMDTNFTAKQKRELIIDSLNRYTKLNTRSFEIKETITMDNPFNYRNKSSLPVRSFNDKSVVGMIDSNTMKITYINTCLVQHALVNEVNEYVLSLIDKYNISVFNDKFKRGVVKFIVTRVSTTSNTCQVTIVCNEVSSKMYSLAKDLIKHKNVSSVYENINDSKKQGIIFGSTFNLLQGTEVITQNIGDIKYNLLPNAFFQLNPYQAAILNEKIKKACKLSKKEVVLDLYCGVGSISLYISKMAKEVIGIEYTKEAVENARKNAIINKISNVKFYDGDVNDVLPKLLLEGLTFDICIVDPPRVGLGQNVIEILIDSNVSKIIYVSCNPSTLAKDLSILSEFYNVKYIEPIDMFPQTARIEAVCVLIRK